MLRKLSSRALIPLMLSSALIGCNEREVVSIAPPPAERYDCATLGARPLASGPERDGIIARYVLDLEERLFACANDAQWLRDYYSALPR